MRPAAEGRRGLRAACRAAAAVLPLLAAAADAAPGWCPPPRLLRETARDDFLAGGPPPQDAGGRWRLEAEHPASAVAVASVDGTGVLDVQAAAGLSLWWRPALQGDYEIRFEARALPAPASAGVWAGRISDLNLFWNATEADGGAVQGRGGRFTDYDTLRTYYAGYGANGNRTTRLRHYDGQGRRSVLDGWADAPEAGPKDTRGGMTAATRLEAGRWLAVAITSHRPDAPDGVHGTVTVDGHRLFTLAQPRPLLEGHFALRTTASHLQVRAFRVLHCVAP